MPFVSYNGYYIMTIINRTKTKTKIRKKKKSAEMCYHRILSNNESSPSSNLVSFCHGQECDHD